MSRLPARLLTVALAVAKTPLRRAPAAGQPVRRILVAHHLLLGDTLLLAPLLAKLAERYPDAERVVLARPGVASLFAARPYGCRVLAYDPRKLADLRLLLAEGPFDLAYVLGDNRYAWLARAAGARWIVGFAQDRPGWKNWMVDEAHPFPAAPVALADLTADLLPGAAPLPFSTTDWPLPDATVPNRPQTPYAVLHVGASTPLKQWPSQRWLALANQLRAAGITPVWSAGKGEEKLVAAINPPADQPRYCGNLSLPELAALLRGAQLLVCPDTGVAHLGKLTRTPTVALFGPGTAAIYGAGVYWQSGLYRALTVADFPCRDQPLLFRREVPWVRRCSRNPQACAVASAGLATEAGTAPCMYGLSLEAVLAACQEFVPELAAMAAGEHR